MSDFFAKLLDTLPRMLRLRSPGRLEKEIADRTADLAALNEALQREIAERQKAQRENEQLLESEQEARRNAERLSNLKDDFLATLSHELRTPINAVVGWTQLLRLGDMSAEDVEQALDVIERNSQIQVQLIDDLLEVSRIIAGKMRLTVQEVDLKEVVLSALATVEPAVTAKNITVLSVLDAESPIVMGDSARLQQVIWNLLSNSVKFTPRDGRIELRLQRVNSHVEVTVTDSGEGIKPDLLPHVFDRFWQADGSASRKHGGLGLGLSIVRQLTEMHGGTVRVHSDGPGHGATFGVSLPVTVFRSGSETDRRAASAAVAPSDNYPPLLGGVRVLVVDDESDARSLVRKTLELGRAEVAAAGSVDEALALFDSFRPHVLVSDIGMPGRDGYALIHEIRSGNTSARDVPAVALTAFVHAADRRRILMSGYQLHIAKPAEPYEIIAAIAGLAGRAGTAERL